MSCSILDTRCSGRRPTAVAFRDSIPSSGFLFARVTAALREPLSNSGASNRHASLLSRSACELGDNGDVPDHQTILIQKVLRFCKKGRTSSPQLTRISSGFLSGNLLAVKGDALIRGPRLVARSVGSEWRTRRPYQMDIQTNKETGDRTK